MHIPDRGWSRDEVMAAMAAALAAGMTIRAAARHCGISVRTAHRRIASARRAMGAPSTGALLAQLHGPSEVPDLTPRQREVLALVARGATTATIAAELGISAATVESHLRAARQRLGTRTRWQAAAIAVGSADEAGDVGDQVAALQRVEQHLAVRADRHEHQVRDRLPGGVEVQVGRQRLRRA